MSTGTWALLAILVGAFMAFSGSHMAVPGDRPTTHRIATVVTAAGSLSVLFGIGLMAGLLISIE